jgi:hypothetical protein
MSAVPQVATMEERARVEPKNASRARRAALVNRVIGPSFFIHQSFLSK